MHADVAEPRRLGHALHAPVQRARLALARLHARLDRQLPDTAVGRSRLTHAQQRIQQQLAAALLQHRQRLASLQAQLSLLDPQRTLERGYAIVQDDKGQVVRSPRQLRPNSTISVRVAEGSAELGIASVQPRLE